MADIVGECTKNVPEGDGLTRFALNPAIARFGVVKVKVQYVFSFEIPFIPVLSTTMTSTSQMVISQ
jgi:hypothetical protein